jgi:hypothetical protein
MPKDPLVPLPADWREQLRARWPDGEKLRCAWTIAADLDTLRDLLLGLPVDVASRIRPDELERAREETLVQLVRPIDLLPNVKEAA